MANFSKKRRELLRELQAIVGWLALFCTGVWWTGTEETGNTAMIVALTAALMACFGVGNVQRRAGAAVAAALATLSGILHLMGIERVYSTGTDQAGQTRDAGGSRAAR